MVGLFSGRRRSGDASTDLRTARLTPSQRLMGVARASPPQERCVGSVIVIEIRSEGSTNELSWNTIHDRALAEGNQITRST